MCDSYEGRFSEHLCVRVHANSPLIALRLNAISSLANLVQVPINPCPYYLSVRWPRSLPFGMAIHGFSLYLTLIQCKIEFYLIIDFFSAFHDSRVEKGKQAVNISNASSSLYLCYNFTSRWKENNVCKKANSSNYFRISFNCINNNSDIYIENYSNFELTLDSNLLVNPRFILFLALVGHRVVHH